MADPNAVTSDSSSSGSQLAAALSAQSNIQPSPAPVSTQLTPPAATPVNGGNAPVARGTPSIWKDIVMGALWGMAGAAGAKNFGEGVAGGVKGVIEEKPAFEAQQNQAAAEYNFKTAQAADLQIDYAYKEKQLNNLSQEQQDAHAENGLRQLAMLKGMGFTPVAVTGDNPGDSLATGRNLMQTHGGVPPLYTVDIGKQHISFDLNQVAGSPQGLTLLNRQRADLGQSPLTPEQFRSLYPTQAAQVAAMHTAMDYAHPVIVDQKSLDDAKARLNTIQGQKTITDEMRADAQSLQAAIDVGEKSVAEQRASALRTAAQRQTYLDLNTPDGRAKLAKQQQDLLNSKYQNAANHQKALFTQGRDPATGETLNLSNAPDEMLIDPNTRQPVPTSMVQTLKPTLQERNRADFANSTLHTLDELDQLRQSGKLPNGPMTGLTAKTLASAGMGSADAQKALNFIALAQSAATGAHVGGRFNEQIMDKMKSLLSINMNDSQFQGAEDSIRDVMTQYSQHGGLETVGQLKRGLIGSVKSVRGQNYLVSGLDKNGNAVLVPLRRQ